MTDHYVQNVLITGDCRDVLEGLEDDSVDAVVCDPPYDLLSSGPRKGSGRSNEGDNPQGRTGGKGGFMGMSWDATGVAFDPATWRAVLRVLKPGGHVLAFGGTRTYHRMVCAIEDAGFEIRDQITWHYGSGFPKSRNVSKDLDKMAGVAPTIIGSYKGATNISKGSSNSYIVSDERTPQTDVQITKPTSPDGIKWEGWGTALKPASEPICLARKPLAKGKTIARNVQEYGTGAINIDGTRIAGDSWHTRTDGGHKGDGGVYGESEKYDSAAHPDGRWPANVVFSCDCEGEHTPGCPCSILDEQSGHSASKRQFTARAVKHNTGILGDFKGQENVVIGHSDEGGASRFFATFRPDSDTLSSVEQQGAPPCGAGSTGAASTSVGKNPASSGGNLPTAGHGSTSEAPSRTDTKSTIRILTPSTMQSTTSNASSPPGMTSTTDCFDNTTELPTALKNANASDAALTSPLMPSTHENPVHMAGTASYAPETHGASGLAPTANTTTPICANTDESEAPSPRFFYVAKPSSRERDQGLENFQSGVARSSMNKSNGQTERFDGNETAVRKNTHPTVKPVALMRYLCRMITPHGGVVLDPFLGSGSTGMAAQAEGFGFIGVELSPEYRAIAAARIASVERPLPGMPAQDLTPQPAVA